MQVFHIQHIREPVSTERGTSTVLAGTTNGHLASVICVTLITKEPRASRKFNTSSQQTALQPTEGTDEGHTQDSIPHGCAVQQSGLCTLSLHKYLLNTTISRQCSKHQELQQQFKHKIPVFWSQTAQVENLILPLTR